MTRPRSALEKVTTSTAITYQFLDEVEVKFLLGQGYKVELYE